jgi:hypothetical protein
MTFWFFFNSAQRRSNKARLQQRLAKERGTVWWTYLSIFSGWGVASKKLGSFIKRPKVDGKDKETLVYKRETGKKRVYIWRVVHGADFFVRPSCVAVCRLWSRSRTRCRTIQRSTPQSLAISFVMPKVIGQCALCAVGCLIDRLSPPVWRSRREKSIDAILGLCQLFNNKTWKTTFHKNMYMYKPRKNKKDNDNTSK